MQKQLYQLIAEQTGESILQRCTCPYTGEEFPVYAGDRALLDKISPTIAGVKYELPNPTISPDVRRLLRMMWRNERHLYRVHSESEDKKLLSMFAPGTVKDVVSLDYQFSDAYDWALYGKDYDPNISFTQQRKSLRDSMPHVGVININNENGQYNNYTDDSKNIYLSFDVMFSENLGYATNIKRVNNGYDLLNVQDSDQIYECTNGRNLSKCVYTTYCSNCYNCQFCFRCINCNNCFFCSKLNNKENHIFNKPASPEEIKALREEMKSYSKFQEYIKNHDHYRRSEVDPNYYMMNCENSFGSSIHDCKNVFRSFDAKEIENCRYNIVAENMKNCMDTTIFNPESENCYLAVCGGYKMKSSIATAVCRESDNTYYSYRSSAGHNIFGSINLHHADHVFLNKKYDPSTREKLVTQCIQNMKNAGEWGEFLDPTLCPFPYNDSVAMDYHPVQEVIYPDGNKKTIHPKGKGKVYLHDPDQFITTAELDLGGSKRIAIKRRTRDVEINIPDGVEVIDAIDLPDHIDHVDDSICRKIIRCIQSDRLYRITSQELAFYRSIGIPLPRIHQDLRHQHRLDYRPARTWHLRSSDKTGKTLISINGPDNPQPVREMEYVYQEMFG